MVHTEVLLDNLLTTFNFAIRKQRECILLDIPSIYSTIVYSDKRTHKHTHAHRVKSSAGTSFIFDDHVIHIYVSFLIKEQSENSV